MTTERDKVMIAVGVILALMIFSMFDGYAWVPPGH